MPHIGEEGTEQFTATTMVDGETIRTQAIHDPFIHSTTVTTLSRWAAFCGIFVRRRIKVEVSVRGTHAAQSRIMTMDPHEMQRENEEWEYACQLRKRGDPAAWDYTIPQGRTGGSTDD